MTLVTLAPLDLQANANPVIEMLTLDLHSETVYHKQGHTRKAMKQGRTLCDCAELDQTEGFLTEGF